jgi:hypothetical protein
MSRNTRVLILGGVLILLLVVAVVTVIVLANRPFAEYDIVSPTALPLFDPFIETQAAQQTQTRDALLIELTAAMDTRVRRPTLIGASCLRKGARRCAHPYLNFCRDAS